MPYGVTQQQGLLVKGCEMALKNKQQVTVNSKPCILFLVINLKTGKIYRATHIWCYFLAWE